MGEAKRRGTLDERVAAAVAKRKAREVAQAAVQAEQKKLQQEKPTNRPVLVTGIQRPNSRLLTIAAILAITARGLK